MIYRQRVLVLVALFIALNPARIDSERPRDARDSDKDGDLMEAMVRRPFQREDKITDRDNVAAAFEHKQHHHLHERQITGKSVIHHVEEPDRIQEKGPMHDGDRKYDTLKDAEIHQHIKASRAHVTEDGDEKEDTKESGEEPKHEARDIHYHIRRKSTVKKMASEGEDIDRETSAEGSNSGRDQVRVEDLHIHQKTAHDFAEHPPEGDDETESDDFEMHLHSDEKKDEEFGYITDEDEANTLDGGHSGEENYEHDHLRTVQLQRRVKTVPATKHARDHHAADNVDNFEHEFVGGEDDDSSEHSGEDEGNGFDQPDDVHLSERSKPSEEHVARLHFDEQDVRETEQHSGGGELTSRRDHVREGRVSEDLHPEPTSGEDENTSGYNSATTSSDHARKSDHQHANVHRKETHPTTKLDESRTVNNDHIVNENNRYQGVESDITSQVEAGIASSEDEDLYIDDSDEPREKLLEVEVRDSSFGQLADDTIGIRHQHTTKASERDETNYVISKNLHRRTSRHLLEVNDNPSDQPDSETPCIHPSHRGPIADGAIVYVRTECRLCLCNKGQLECEPKSPSCGKHKARRCQVAEGKHISDGERHIHGCNHCLCRSGELLCTHSRCKEAGPKHDIKPVNDLCMLCDRDAGSPVCGPNWKTYSSMCHAQECAGLDLENVKEGRCESLDPCDDAKCREHEICLPSRRGGPCLATSSVDGNVVECPQYQCEQDCSLVPDGKVCGMDKNTYLNACVMFAKGIALAYEGPCQDGCLEAEAKMCGMGGVTLQSACHAQLSHSHVDYPGECEDQLGIDNMIHNSNMSEEYVSTQCKMVLEMARCPFADCGEPVVPEGACCSICGAAVSIRLDAAAKDMTALTEMKPPKDFNRLDFVYDNLKNLLHKFGGSSNCQLTADLLDTNDISVVYTPIKSADQMTCAEVANKTVEFINSPNKNDMEPFEALLAAAVKVETMEPGFVSEEFVTPKKRQKRVQHHEHEPLIERSSQVRHQVAPYNAALFMNWYWFTTQVYN